MPQSLSNILIHFIWSTKDRHPCLSPGIREKTHAFLAGAVRQMDCEAYRVGGVADHVHLAVRLSRTLSVAVCLPQRGKAYQPGATPWVGNATISRVLKERRISSNGGRVTKQSQCGVPSERINGIPRIPRVLPWAVMRGPVGAEITCPAGARITLI